MDEKIYRCPAKEQARIRCLSALWDELIGSMQILAEELQARVRTVTR